MGPASGARGVLSAQPAPALAAAGLPARARLGPAAVRVDLSDGALPAAGARLTKQLDAPVPTGSGVALAYHDDRRNMWVTADGRVARPAHADRDRAPLQRLG